MALGALIFDCDGVLVDTERDGHRVGFNRAFKEMGIDAEWSIELYGKLLQVAGGKERMRRLMAMVANRRVDLSPLVTHRFAFDRIDEAIDLFSSQRDGVLKVALHPQLPHRRDERVPVGAGVEEIC